MTCSENYDLNFPSVESRRSSALASVRVEWRSYSSVERVPSQKFLRGTPEPISARERFKNFRRPPNHLKLEKQNGCLEPRNGNGGTTTTSFVLRSRWTVDPKYAQPWLGSTAREHPRPRPSDKNLGSVRAYLLQQCRSHSNGEMNIPYVRASVE